MGDGVEVYTTLADAEEALAIAQEGRPHREFRIVPSYDPAAELDPEA